MHSHIYDCDLLIIDDLGTEMAEFIYVSQLFICLNERILRQKSTIISTNLALDDIKTFIRNGFFHESAVIIQFCVLPVMISVSKKNY